jgi:hypothetical protein
MTSNALYRKTIEDSRSIPLVNGSNLLPDLAAQIQSFIHENTTSKNLSETIFIVSSGFWDIYNYASIDFELGKNATDTAVDELFDQLSILYSHLTSRITSPENNSRSNTSTQADPPTFQVMLPKLLDPSLTPGWLSHRPLPLKPSSIAEQQKNAMYLTARWNMRIENKMVSWMKPPPSDTSTTNPSSIQTVEKDIFYFDLPETVLDMMIEFQLQDTGISESADSGLGKGYTPFDCVDVPCLRDSRFEEESEEEEFDELNGMLVCKTPDEYMFWDAFGIGSVAKKNIALEAATFVSGGKSVRARIDKSYGGHGGDS